MGVLFRYEVSDLVIRQELITTGMHGPCERKRFFGSHALTPKIRTLFATSRHTNRRGRPVMVRLLTYLVRSDVSGVRVESRPMKLDVAVPTAEQIEQALLRMIQDKARAEIAVKRATAANLARARDQLHVLSLSTA